MNGCVEQQWKPARMHTLTPKELGLPKQAARHKAWAQARAQGASTFKDFPARALHSHPNTQRTGNSKQCGRAHGHRTSIDGGRSHRDSTGSGVSSSRIGSRSLGRGRSRSADVRSMFSGMSSKQRGRHLHHQGALARVTTHPVRILPPGVRPGVLSRDVAASTNQAEHNGKSAGFKSNAVGLEVELIERLRAADTVWQNSVAAGSDSATQVSLEMLVRAKLQPVRWTLEQLSQVLPGQAGVLSRLAGECSALIEGLQQGSASTVCDPRSESAGSTNELSHQVSNEASVEIGLLRARVQELELALKLERDTRPVSSNQSSKISPRLLNHTNNAVPSISPKPELDTAFMEPSPISQRSASSFDADADADADGTTGAHKDDTNIWACCTPASTASTTSSCTSVHVVRPTRIEAADRVRPTAVPMLQLGAMKAKMEVQSYQDEFMCHKNEWSQSWREEDAGVLEQGRQ